MLEAYLEQLANQLIKQADPTFSGNSHRKKEVRRKELLSLNAEILCGLGLVEKELNNISTDKTTLNQLKARHQGFTDHYRKKHAKLG
jgi:hypothetical protein